MPVASPPVGLGHERFVRQARLRARSLPWRAEVSCGPLKFDKAHTDAPPSRALDPEVPVDVIVKSKNCDIPARLREEAVQRLEHATRFFDRLSGVEMVFSEEGNPRIPEPALVEVTARAKGHHIRAEGSGADHRKAVDAAVARFERQLSRHKARLVDRHRRAGRSTPSSNGLLEQGEVTESAAPVETDDAAPAIVRTKRFELVPMLPEEAAWQLELLGHDFYMFTNAATGACNLVYRRKDGDLGLIESVT